MIVRRFNMTIYSQGGDFSMSISNWDLSTDSVVKAPAVKVKKKPSWQSASENAVTVKIGNRSFGGNAFIRTVMVEKGTDK
jgi:hypothetical protein